MDEQLHQSIAREVLRLAIQLGSGGDMLSGPAPLPAAKPVRSKDDAVRYYRQQLLSLDRGLTSRELDVGARSLAGMTAEGTALELNIKTSSVVTYRKRAYGRLGISSLYELFRFVA
jgi:DNA-binding CsgD family transcriptional regulator